MLGASLFTTVTSMIWCIKSCLKGSDLNCALLVIYSRPLLVAHYHPQTPVLACTLIDVHIILFYFRFKLDIFQIIFALVEQR